MRPNRPNIVLVLADDLGFSDVGCYGGEIDTPHLDRLARDGVRMSQFYNTARCSPSRASLLTGLHPHQTGIGILTTDQRPYGYQGFLNDRCVTLAEVLRDAGYGTYLSGKWHLTGSFTEPDGVWPTERGFDRFFGTLGGAGSYYDPITLTRDTTPVDRSELGEDWYYTDAISDEAARFITEHVAEQVDGHRDDPFFCYVAYTAPHWPLHAPEDAVRAYDGRYDAGWDDLRRARTERLVADGVLDDRALSDRDPEVPAWDDVPDQEWEARRMQVYAAQVTAMDAGIGRIVDALEATGRLEDTIVIFLSDNGGSAEGQPTGYVDEAADVRPTVNLATRDGRRVFRGNVPEVAPGPPDTWASYGRAWSNLSNAPFRKHKSWVHEGGISTPFVVHWPAGLGRAGGVSHDPHQLPDVMATLLEATGVAYPGTFPGRDPLPPEGTSMLPAWRGETEAGETGTADGGHTLYWEHMGNAAVRRGRWKLVRDHPGGWELYDIRADRAERHDLAARHPGVVAELEAAYEAWAARCDVIPREQVLAGGSPRHVSRA